MHTSLLLSSALAGVAAGLGDSTKPLSSVDDQAWDQLKTSVGGKLYEGRPYNGPCYTKYEDGTDAFNGSECQTISDSLTDVETLISDFGSYVNPSFGSCIATGDKCTLRTDGGSSNTTLDTCYQGSVSPKFVDARSVEDVQAAAEFAYEHKLPVTIKNTGHDYRGYSAAPDTFAIWTHNIRSELKLTENFSPDGGSDAGPAVTYGAGETFSGLYDFLSEEGYIMVGGSCLTVGAAGGYLAGGGYGTLTQEHGLAVDNALQIKVVLVNGTYVTANRYQNQDLFFALRGGGGGTFGVVTEVTTKAIKDDKPVAVAALSIVVPDPQKATEIFVDNAEAWAEAGITGSIGVRSGNAASVIGISSALDIDQLKDALKDVSDYFESVSSDSNPFNPVFTSFDNFYAVNTSPLSVGFAARGIGNTGITASRLIPREHFADTESRKELVDVLVQNPYGAMLTPPVKYKLPESDVQGGPGQASVTPAWRNALWHVVHQTFYDPADPISTTPENSAKIFQNLSNSVDALRELTPSSGAYMNEGDTFEPDAPNSFWGKDNYDRLLAIKEQVDPLNQLSCLKCVGADKSAERNKCYPKI